MEISVASGATPATPSGTGADAAVISEATMVPWASQSVRPSPPVM